MVRKPAMTAAMLAIVATASGATHQAVLVSEGYLQETGEPYSTWQITIALEPGEDWQAADMNAYMEGGGEFFQHFLDGIGDPPNPILFSAFPDLEYTSYYTSPAEWPNTDYAGDIVYVMKDDTPMVLTAAWWDTVTVTGPGEFVIAQITVLPWEDQWWGLKCGYLELYRTLWYCTATVFFTRRRQRGVYGGARHDRFLGNVVVGETSNPQTFTVHNDTPEYLELYIYCYDCGSEYDYTPEWAYGLLPGESEQFDVTFSPSELGLNEATMSIEGWYEFIWDPNMPPGTGICGGTIHVELSGTGILPALGVDPEFLDFGDAFIGQASSPRMITLSNNSGVEIQVGRSDAVWAQSRRF